MNTFKGPNTDLYFLIQVILSVKIVLYLRAQRSQTAWVQVLALSLIIYNSHR